LMIFSSIIKLWSSHISHVNKVLHLLSKHQLLLKKSKCSFGASKVEYLGHIFGKDGI
jgi:hypothetical protein